jgi:uncharacterized membrane protein YtjA (UPF0391 family)
MLYWAPMFLIIAIIAGFLGFGRIAFAAAGIAKILFFIFLVVFVVMLLTGLWAEEARLFSATLRKFANVAAAAHCGSITACKSALSKLLRLLTSSGLQERSEYARCASISA